jgi:5-methylcytosine-specific restriction protein B
MSFTVPFRVVPRDSTLEWRSAALGMALVRPSVCAGAARAARLAAGKAGVVADGTIWVIHAGRNDEADALFRERGLIALGWEQLGDLAQLPPTREDFKAALAAVSPGYKPGAIPNIAGQLFRFVHEMRPGDTVLYPARRDSQIHIGRVAGPYRHDPAAADGFPHQRPVEWVRAVPRSVFSKTARDEIGGLQTLSSVKRTAAEFVAARDGLPPPPAAPPLDEAADAVVTPAAGGGDELAPDATLLTTLAAALERKGQIILYGPPGTGKTYAARRFAVWWLARSGDQGGDAAVLTDNAAFLAAERDLAAVPPGVGAAQLTTLTFHPAYSYEDFIEGFKPAPGGDGTLRLTLQGGVFKRVCQEAGEHRDRRYLVLIDEINRANLASVFGELLTLLERDKRGMAVLLPQSKEPFAIPPNVYLLGTMNTADRSIKVLDSALRRRFAWEELLPDPTLLAGAAIGGLALDRFLAELNRRVARREGREKQIGHAYLLDAGQPVATPEEFAERFRQEILPLLQEYCYDDYAELAEYVGTALVDRQGQRLNSALLDDPDALIAALANEFAAADDDTSADSDAAP